MSRLFILGLLLTGCTTIPFEVGDCITEGSKPYIDPYSTCKVTAIEKTEFSCAQPIALAFFGERKQIGLRTIKARISTIKEFDLVKTECPKDIIFQEEQGE